MEVRFILFIVARCCPLLSGNCTYKPILPENTKNGSPPERLDKGSKRCLEVAEGAGLISASSLHPLRGSLCVVCAAPRRSNCGHHPAVLLFESAPRIYGGRGGIRTRGRLPYVRFRVECLKPDSATLPCRRSNSLRNKLLCSFFIRRF